jgi:PAS domain S-box-containing protein
VKHNSIFSKSTYRYLNISVIVLYTVISFFFLLNSEIQHRRTKNILVEAAIDRTNAYINTNLYTIGSAFSQILTLITENQEVLSALALSDSDQIENSVLPYYKALANPLGANITIFSPNNEIIYSSSNNPQAFNPAFVPFIVSNTNQLGFFAFGHDGFFFVAQKDIDTRNGTATVFVSILDTEALKLIEDISNLPLFTVFDKHQIKGTHQLGKEENGKIIRYYNHESLVYSFFTKIDSKLLLDKHQVSINSKQYFVVKFIDYRIDAESIGASSYCIIDISDYQKAYVNHLIRIVLIIVFLFIAVIIFLRLFRTKILNAALNLRNSFEDKLTERTREVIHESDQLNQIFNASANGIRIIDKDFNVIKVNESFCKLSGTPFHAETDEKCFNIFPSTFCHTDNCPLEQIKCGAEIVEHKEIRFNRNAQKVTCQYKAKPLLGLNGELLGIIEDFKDITQLEIEEERHKQTQKQFESLLASMPVGVFIRDFEGNMFYQNSYMDKAFGPFTYEKKNIRYVFPTNQVNRFFEEDKFVERYGSIIVEEQLIDKNQVERTYVTHKFKFFGADNKMMIGGVAIDISKRKQAENNFYVLSKAINNTPIGILITSPEGIVETCNPEFEQICGQTSEHLIGNTIPQLFDKSSGKLFDAINVALMGTVHQEEINVKIFKEQSNWFSFSVSPVLNRHGNVAHLIFVFDDITQRKEYEKEINIAKTRAEESDKLKSAFLNNLSHEIRTPLNAILGFSSLLNNSTVSVEEKNDIPKQLINHSNSLLEFINDLIDIAAIETNQFAVKKRECQLNKIVTDTFNEVLRSNQNSRLKTSIKLGVVEENFTILSDPDRIAQLVRHLLSNALKFTSTGFVELGYTFKDASTLLFYLIDTGVGLTKEEKSIIFNPFRQADDSSTRSHNGLGLGLAISKHIVERLGGRIWVDSTKDQGATFFFTLPYIPVRAKFDEFVEPSKEINAFNWKSKTILVADDIDSNFYFLQAIIKPTGANVLWAKNGREAVDTVKSKQIDLVLMDIIMPELNGFEATKQIKSYNSDIKVICQTAYPSPEHQSAGFQSGMDKFLSKPIAANNMMLLIDEYIHQN